jgi:hypothetical protein
VSLRGGEGQEEPGREECHGVMVSW